MNKAIIKYWVDIGLLISFLLVTLTGIFKFPGIREHLASLYVIIPRAQMTLIHDWSGIFMALLVVVHLVLNLGWIKSMTKNIFCKKK